MHSASVMNRCEVVKELGAPTQLVVESSTRNDDVYLQFQLPGGCDETSSGIEASCQESKEPIVKEVSKNQPLQAGILQERAQFPTDPSPASKEEESSRESDNRSPVSVTSMLADEPGSALLADKTMAAFEEFGQGRPSLQRSRSWSAHDTLGLLDDDDDDVPLKPASTKDVLGGGILGGGTTFRRKKANSELSKSEHVLSNKVTELSNKGRFFFKKTQDTFGKVTSKIMFPSRSKQTPMQMMESCASFEESTDDSFAFDPDASSDSSCFAGENEGSSSSELPPPTQTEFVLKGDHKEANDAPSAPAPEHSESADTKLTEPTCDSLSDHVSIGFVTKSTCLPNQLPEGVVRVRGTRPNKESEEEPSAPASEESESAHTKTSHQSDEASIGFVTKRTRFERSTGSSLQLSRSLSLSDLIVELEEEDKAKSKPKGEDRPEDKKKAAPERASSSSAKRRTKRHELSVSEHVPRKSHSGARRQNSTSHRRPSMSKDTRRSSSHAPSRSSSTPEKKERESNSSRRHGQSHSHRRQSRSSKKKDELSKSEHGSLKPKEVDDKLHSSFSAGMSMDLPATTLQEESSATKVLDPHFSWDLSQLTLMEKLLNEENDNKALKNERLRKAFASVKKRIPGIKMGNANDNDVSCSNLGLMEDSMSYQEEFDLLASIRELEDMNDVFNAKNKHEVVLPAKLRKEAVLPPRKKNEVVLPRSNSRCTIGAQTEDSMTYQDDFDLTASIQKLEDLNAKRNATSKFQWEAPEEESTSHEDDPNLAADTREGEDLNRRHVSRRRSHEGKRPGSRRTSAADLSSPDATKSSRRPSRRSVKRSLSQPNLVGVSPSSQEKGKINNAQDRRRPSRRPSGGRRKASSNSRERKRRSKSRERRVARANSLRDLKSPTKSSSGRDLRSPTKSAVGTKRVVAGQKEGTSPRTPSQTPGRQVVQRRASTGGPPEALTRRKSAGGPEESKPSSWRDLYNKAPGVSNPRSNIRPSSVQSVRKGRIVNNRRQSTTEEPTDRRSLLQRSDTAQRHLENRVFKFPINKTQNSNRPSATREDSLGRESKSEEFTPTTSDKRASSSLASPGGVCTRRGSTVTPGGRDLELRQW